MKLQTLIPARRDGTLNVRGLNGRDYSFYLDSDSGVLTGEVDDVSTVAHLLSTGNFYPENPEDFDAALRLGGDNQDQDQDQDDGDGDGDSHQTGLPVEANTPLQSLPNRKSGGNRKRQAGK